MWTPMRLELSARRYQFEHVSMGEHRDTALLADGEVLFNMLRCTEWQRDPVQVLVCETCGISGCRPGGYVSIRRAAGFVIVMRPLRSFENDERVEFAPPPLIFRRGALAMTCDAWQQLSVAGSGLPEAEALTELSWAESWALAQSEAPHHLLGRPGAQASRRLSALVEATDPFVEPPLLDQLGQFDGWSTGAEAGVDLVAVEQTMPLSLFLSSPLEEVRLFAKVGVSWGLMLAPDLVALPRVRHKP